MIFDIVAAAFTLVLSLVMMKKGGIKAIMSLGGLVLSLIVASMLYPALSDAVYKTPLPENLQAIVEEAITTEDTAIFESADALPEFMQHAISSQVDETVDNITKAVSESVTRVIINVIIFVLLVIATKLVISLITLSLNIASKLPVIHQLNSLIGLGCGIAISAVVLWIAVAVMSSVGASNVQVAQWIKDSYVVDFMSNISPF